MTSQRLQLDGPPLSKDEKKPTVERTQFGFLQVPIPGEPQTIMAMREYARRFAKIAIDTLAGIADDQFSPKIARVAAASEILNRAYGKPAQEIINSEKPKIRLDLSKLSDSELFMYEMMLAKIAAPAVEKEMKNVTPSVEFIPQEKREV